jgi:hypothetical protein
MRKKIKYLLDAFLPCISGLFEQSHCADALTLFAVWRMDNKMNASISKLDNIDCRSFLGIMPTSRWFLVEHIKKCM